MQWCAVYTDFAVAQEEPKKSEKKEETKKVSRTSHASLLALTLQQKTEEPKKKAEEPKKARLTSRITPHSRHASLPITVHT